MMEFFETSLLVQSLQFVIFKSLGFMDGLEISKVRMEAALIRLWSNE